MTAGRSEERRPVAFITGATSGLGQALAWRLSQSHRLILSGSRSQESAALPEGALYLQADLTDPHGAALFILDDLETRGISAIDLAILNAGIGHYGDPLAETPAMIRKTLAVVLGAPMALAHGLYGPLERSGGRLCLVGSVARRGSAKMASYAAAKAGLDGFGRALGEEWRGRVAVTLIHPGPIATGMHERAGFDPGRMKRVFAEADEMAAMVLEAVDRGDGRRTIGTIATLRRRLLGGKGR